MNKLLLLILLLLLPAGCFSQQWINKFNYTGSSRVESANTVLTDASANVYIIGNSVSGAANAFPYDNDIVVYKYNSAGTQQWVVTYSGLAGGKDTVTKAVIDGSGNIYLTGCTTVSSSDSTDILTMMISSAGIIVWTKTYKYDVGLYFDNGNDICVDASGNVFVTGETSQVLVLLKYNNNGILQFAKPNGGSIAVGNSICLDGSGNIYVSGSFVSPSFSVTEPFSTKYNSSGTMLWFYIVNAGGYSTRVRVDANGNVFFNINGNNSGGKVVKCNSSGTLLLNNTLGNNSTLDDLELDALGNIYVCGADNSGGFIGVYTSSLSLIWTASVSSGGSAIEFYSMLVDGFFNVYATGNSDAKTITSKYNSSGVKQWSVSETSAAGSAQANSIALDNNSSLLIAGSNDAAVTGQDFYAVRYTTAGGHHWLRSINRLASFSDVVTSAEPDNAGNYYLAGYVNLSTSVYGIQVGYGIIEKINSAGSVVWSRADTTYNNIRYNDIAADASGNIYVTGTSNEDCITIKLNSSGTVLWSKVFNPSFLGYDEGTSITVDANGNVFVCGTSYKNSITLLDMVTIKYNSAGVFQWSQYYDGGASGYYDFGIKVKVDGTGNIITAGNYRTNNSAAVDIVVMKFNQAGTVLWTDMIGGTGSGSDSVSDMVLDNSNNIYLTGVLVQSGANKDLFAAKIGVDGTVLWNTPYNSGGTTEDKGVSLCTDKSGNVISTGYSVSPVSNSTILTVQFNSSGIFQWAKTIQGTGSMSSGTSVSSDSSGNIFVAGKFYNSSHYYIFMGKFNSLGVPSVSKFYDVAGSGDCESKTAFLNSAGDYLIAANIFEGTQKQNIALLNYDRTTFAIKVKIVAGIEGLWNGVSQTRDTVAVYLRENAFPYKKLDSAYAYLSSACEDTVVFYSAIGNQYYLSVSHRNSLEIWTPAISFYNVGSYYVQDFTASQSTAYGNNLVFYNNKWCIYSGDINKDGFINGNDFTQFSSQFGLSGYLGSDLNNDGVVNGNDFTVFSSSFGKIASHP